MEERIDNKESKNKYINFNNKIMEEIKNKIVSLEKEYSEVINRKNGIILFKDEEILDLRNKLENKNKEIIVLNSNIADENNKNIQLKNELSKNKIEISKIKSDCDDRINTIENERNRLRLDILILSDEIEKINSNNHDLNRIKNSYNIKRIGNQISGWNGNISIYSIKNPIKVIKQI